MAYIQITTNDYSIVRYTTAWSHITRSLDISKQKAPDPLGDGPVLLPLLGEDPLNPEGLQRRHFRLQRTQTLISMEMKNRYMYVYKYYTVESYVPMYKMFE